MVNAKMPNEPAPDGTQDDNGGLFLFITREQAEATASASTECCEQLQLEFGVELGIMRHLASSTKLQAACVRYNAHLRQTGPKLAIGKVPNEASNP